MRDGLMYSMQTTLVCSVLISTHCPRLPRCRWLERSTCNGIWSEQRCVCFCGPLDSCCRNNMVSHHMVSDQGFMQALTL